MDGCESWTRKKAKRQRIDAFELWCWRRLLKSPLDFKEIKSVNPKGNQPWIFFGRTDAEAEASILWSPDAKSRFTGKNPDAGKDWGQEEKEATEDEMVGWAYGHTTLTRPISSDLGSIWMGDGWMVSPTQWTWVWTNSGRWWRTGKPGVLQFSGRKESDMTAAKQQHQCISWASQVVLVVKNPPVNAGDTGDASSIPGLGRSLLWLSWWRIRLQCKRPGFDSWVGKIP